MSESTRSAVPGSGHDSAGGPADERLVALLADPTLAPHELVARVRERADEDGEGVYASVLRLLSRLEFEPAEAARHWEAILEHRIAMERLLGAPVEIQVALVRYFLHIHRKLRSPMVVELALFERTRASAYRDELTGLYNLRYLNEALARELARSDRTNAPLSLIMLDVDDFKTFNDRHGHVAGNRALGLVANVLTRAIRGSDIAARYGGEEFTVVLPDTPKLAARSVAERVLRTLREQTLVANDSGSAVSLTASAGIATYPADGDAAAALLQSADVALYAAKEGGKNRIQLYGESERSFRRVRANVAGRVRMAGDGFEPLTTATVGEGGIAFRTSTPLPVHAAAEVRLALPDGSTEIRAIGEIVRVGPGADGAHESVLQILHIAPNDRNALSAFVAGRPTDAH